LLQLSNVLLSFHAFVVEYNSKQKVPVENAQVKFWKVIYSGA